MQLPVIFRSKELHKDQFVLANQKWIFQCSYSHYYGALARVSCNKRKIGGIRNLTGIFLEILGALKKIWNMLFKGLICHQNMEKNTSFTQTELRSNMIPRISVQVTEV